MSETRTEPRRTTKQRVAVTEALADAPDFVTAQDLHARLRAAGDSVGLATVYRNLNAMADEGTVDVLRTDDGEARYRLCSTEEHHHHLVCRDCGRTVEVEGPEVEAWATAVGQANRFVDVTHTIEIFGLCPRCA